MGVAVIPEVGPLLGRMLHPPAAELALCPELDQVRAGLLMAIFEQAGAARRHLAAGNESAAAAAIGAGSWLAAWEHAVDEGAQAVSLEVVRRLRAAAQLSRAPSRRLTAALPESDDRRVLRARLSAAGVPFEAALSHFGTGSVPRDEALRRVAGALDEAWSSLAAVAREEIELWERRAGELRAWRRPWAPLLVSGAAGLAVALLAGLALGGYLPVPRWFRPIAEWVWNLGWP